MCLVFWGFFLGGVRFVFKSTVLKANDFFNHWFTYNMGILIQHKNNLLSMYLIHLFRMKPFIEFLQCSRNELIIKSKIRLVTKKMRLYRL